MDSYNGDFFLSQEPFQSLNFSLLGGQRASTSGQTHPSSNSFPRFDREGSDGTQHQQSEAAAQHLSPQVPHSGSGSKKSATKCSTPECSGRANQNCPQTFCKGCCARAGITCKAHSHRSSHVGTTSGQQTLQTPQPRGQPLSLAESFMPSVQDSANKGDGSSSRKESQSGGPLGSWPEMTGKGALEGYGLQSSQFIPTAAKGMEPRGKGFTPVQPAGREAGSQSVDMTAKAQEQSPGLHTRSLLSGASQGHATGVEALAPMQQMLLGDDLADEQLLEQQLREHDRMAGEQAKALAASQQQAQHAQQQADLWKRPEFLLQLQLRLQQQGITSPELIQSHMQQLQYKYQLAAHMRQNEFLQLQAQVQQSKQQQEEERGMQRGASPQLRDHLGNWQQSSQQENGAGFLQLSQRSNLRPHGLVEAAAADRAAHNTGSSEAWQHQAPVMDSLKQNTFAGGSQSTGQGAFPSGGFAGMQRGNTSGQGWKQSSSPQISSQIGSRDRSDPAAMHHIMQLLVQQRAGEVSAAPQQLGLLQHLQTAVANGLNISESGGRGTPPQQGFRRPTIAAGAQSPARKESQEASASSAAAVPQQHVPTPPEESNRNNHQTAPQSLTLPRQSSPSLPSTELQLRHLQQQVAALQQQRAQQARPLQWPAQQSMSSPEASAASMQSEEVPRPVEDGGGATASFQGVSQGDRPAASSGAPDGTQVAVSRKRKVDKVPAQRGSKKQQLALEGSQRGVNSTPGRGAGFQQLPTVNGTSTAAGSFTLQFGALQQHSKAAVLNSQLVCGGQLSGAPPGSGEPGPPPGGANRQQQSLFSTPQSKFAQPQPADPIIQRPTTTAALQQPQTPSSSGLGAPLPGTTPTLPIRPPSEIYPTGVSAPPIPPLQAPRPPGYRPQGTPSSGPRPTGPQPPGAPLRPPGLRPRPPGLRPRPSGGAPPGVLPRAPLGPRPPGARPAVRAPPAGQVRPLRPLQPRPRGAMAASPRPAGVTPRGMRGVRPPGARPVARGVRPMMGGPRPGGPRLQGVRPPQGVAGGMRPGQGRGGPPFLRPPGGNVLLRPGQSASAAVSAPPRPAAQGLAMPGAAPAVTGVPSGGANLGEAFVGGSQEVRSGSGTGGNKAAVPGQQGGAPGVGLSQGVHSRGLQASSDTGASPVDFPAATVLGGQLAGAETASAEAQANALPPRPLPAAQQALGGGASVRQNETGASSEVLPPGGGAGKLIGLSAIWPVSQVKGEDNTTGTENGQSAQRQSYPPTLGAVNGHKSAPQGQFLQGAASPQMAAGSTTAASSVGAFLEGGAKVLGRDAGERAKAVLMEQITREAQAAIARNAQAAIKAAQERQQQQELEAQAGERREAADRLKQEEAQAKTEADMQVEMAREEGGAEEAERFSRGWKVAATPWEAELAWSAAVGREPEKLGQDSAARCQEEDEADNGAEVARATERLRETTQLMQVVTPVLPNDVMHAKSVALREVAVYLAAKRAAEDATWMADKARLEEGVPGAVDGVVDSRAEGLIEGTVSGGEERDVAVARHRPSRDCPTWPATIQHCEEQLQRLEERLARLESAPAAAQVLQEVVTLDTAMTVGTGLTASQLIEEYYSRFKGLVDAGKLAKLRSNPAPGGVRSAPAQRQCLKRPWDSSFPLLDVSKLKRACM